MKIEELPISDRYGFEVFYGDCAGMKNLIRTKTDEFLDDNGNWRAIDPAGDLGQRTIYRRPINVGEGYRLVGLDEAIEDGDEFLSEHNNWLETGAYGKTPRQVTSEVIVRRKIATKQEQVTFNPDKPYACRDGCAAEIVSRNFTTEQPFLFIRTARNEKRSAYSANEYGMIAPFSGESGIDLINTHETITIPALVIMTDGRVYRSEMQTAPLTGWRSDVLAVLRDIKVTKGQGL